MKDMLFNNGSLYEAFFFFLLLALALTHMKQTHALQHAACMQPSAAGHMRHM
jgi:hypothetical protein